MAAVTVPQLALDAKRSETLGIRFNRHTFIRLKPQTHGAIATASDLLDKTMAETAIIILDWTAPSVAQTLALVVGTLRDNQGLFAKLERLLTLRPDWDFQRAILTSVDCGVDKLISCGGEDTRPGER